MPSFGVAKKVIVLYFFIFGCTGVFTHAFSAEAEFVKNLNKEFLIFSSYNNSLLPLIDQSDDINVVYLKISAADISNHKLQINSKRDFYIYAESKLVYHANKGSYWINPADLMKGQLDKDHIFLAFYAFEATKSLNVDLYRINYSDFKKIEKNPAKTQQEFLLIPNDVKKNKYIIGLILSLITFILLKFLVPDIYLRIFKLKVDMNALMDRSSSKLTYFQNESIFIFLFISILAGIYMYVFLDKDTYISGYKILNSAHDANLFTYGLVSTFLLFFLKYIIYKMVSYIFKVESFSKILINEFSKTIFQSILFIYPIYFILFSPYYAFESNSFLKFVYPVVFVLFLFIIKELYYFYHLFNSNKFYIIAYICICDLFPTCVFFKILSQSEFI